MITITKERLLKIQQWRETYGSGSNVVLPAEEAEVLAHIALASLEAEPVIYVMAGEDFDTEATSTSKAVVDGWVDEWNQVGEPGYRTVPLFTATPGSVVPDGYVLVPIEPTEEMIVQGFESEPDESFSDAEVWEAYESMSGCQQAAHRAKLCWVAMIAAAPQQEVKL